MARASNCLALVALMIAAPAIAADVTVDFQATNGADVLGSFTYDSAAPAGTVTSDGEDWFYGVANLAYTVDGAPGDTSGLATLIRLTDAPAGGGTDALYLPSNGSDGEPNGARYELSLYDNTGMSVNGPTLPESFNVTQGVFSYAPLSPDGGVSEAKISVPISATFSVAAPTPEIPAWASLGIGLLLLAPMAIGWRRRPARRTPAIA